MSQFLHARNMFRSQGAFEYILLLAGVLAIVVIVIVFLRGAATTTINQTVAAGVQQWIGAIQITLTPTPTPTLTIVLNPPTTTFANNVTTASNMTFNVSLSLAGNATLEIVTSSATNYSMDCIALVCTKTLLLPPANYSFRVWANTSPTTSNVTPWYWSLTGWWSLAYGARRQINVSTTTSLPIGYSVNLSFNSSQLIAAGKMLSNGNDARIVFWNSSTGYNLELDRANETEFGNFSKNTELWFALRENVSANNYTTAYWLYYNNSLAGAPPANRDNIYALYDDFSGTSINTSKWTLLTLGGSSVTVAGGVANFSTPSIVGAIARLTTVDALSEASVFETRVLALTPGIVGWHNFWQGSENYSYMWIRDARKWRLYNTTGWSAEYLGTYQPTSGSYFFKSILTPSVSKIDVGGTLTDSANITGSFSLSNAKFFVEAAMGVKMDLDWVKLRKYVPPEPIATLGQEQLKP